MKGFRLIASVAVSGALVLVATVRPAAWLGSSSSALGYSFRFAERAGQPLPGENAGATVYVGTNLPDGTLVVVAGGSVHTHPSQAAAVWAGAVRISVSNDHCYNAFQREDATFAVSIGASPVIDDAFLVEITGSLPECFRPEGCDVPQPRSVLHELGANFDRLSGPQVRTWDGGRAIVARSPAYSWPKNSCARTLTQTRLEECPAQRSIFALTTAQLEWYPSQVLSMGNQWKPCMVYASASPELRAQQPWPSFRDIFTAWLEKVSRASEGPLRQAITSTSPERFGFRASTLPERFTVDYTKGGAVIATASFVHDSDRYELVTLDLKT